MTTNIARSRLRGGGSRPADRSARSPYALESRELDVLRLLVEGLSPRQVSASLQLRTPVVEHRLNSIKTKMCARSNTEAAVKAIRERILE